MGAEKIARMMGRGGAFHDLRVGLGNSIATGDSDADIKFALGVAQSECGWLACAILVAKYASSINDAEEIARAYIRDTRVSTHGAPVHRLAALLAVRQLAGQTITAALSKHWGWILGCNYQVVLEAVRAASDWLDDQWPSARNAFLVAIGDREAEHAKDLYERRVVARA